MEETMQKKDIIEIEEVSDLTPMQEGMLYQKMLNEESFIYFEQSIFYLNGKLDQESIQEAFYCLTVKHEILRAVVFYRELSEPKMVILKKRKPEFKMLYIGDETYPEEKLKEICKEDQKRGFDLEKDTLIRGKLIHMSEEKYAMVWSFHHIIMDGWCMSLVYRDFINYYVQLRNGKSEEQLINEIQQDKNGKENYTDYIRWLKSQDMEESLTYWAEILEGYDHVAEIDGMGGNPNSTEQVAKVELQVEDNLDRMFKQCATDCCVTENTIVETAWGILLQKYSRSHDVVFGKVVSGRNAPVEGIDDMVGLFINAIPTRVKADEEETISEILQRVQEDSIKASNYDHCSLAEIQGRVRNVRGLIRTLYVYENYYIDKKGIDDGISKMNGLDISMESSVEQTEYALQLTAYRSKRLCIALTYDPAKYGEKEVKQILTHLKTIIDKISSNPMQKIAELEVITEEEKEKMLGKFNDTDADYPKEKTIAAMFEEQVRKHPDHIAITFEGENLSYRELNAKANQLGRKLRKLGVKQDDLVAIKVDRSFEMVVAMYAVVKAGGAYVPINTMYPEERINYILEDSGAKILLTDAPALYQDREIEVIDVCNSENYKENTRNLTHVNKPRDILYVIYTSGTTGKPKGVMVTNQNVVRLLKNDKFQYDFNEMDTWTMFHSYGFDFSVWEMYGAGLNGGKLVIVSEETTQDSKLFLEVLKKEKVSVLNQVPSSFYQLMREEDDAELNLHYLIFGGEALSPSRLKEWHNRHPETKIVNMYGITETTVHVTYREIGEKEIEAGISDIGKPIPTLKVYIMDGDHLCGVGVPGELCVTGDGVARGYLNREELTNGRFVRNLFGEGRMYRSGDLARWCPDGNIEYLGRVDEQVKIRGFRIELGEIENVIRNSTAVKDVVVLERTLQNLDNQLVAFYVADDTLDKNILINQIKNKLPNYMIPSIFKRIDAIPINKNGKTDRNALRRINIKAEKPKLERNLTQNEKYLLHVWKDNLVIEDVGIFDDYFELGGNSIKLMSMVNEIRQKGFKIRVEDIFQYSTIESLSAQIMDMQNVIVESESNIIINVEKNYQVIESITENKDNFKWEELNCFYRPLAIIFQSYHKEYFDNFILYVTFYNLYKMNNYFATSDFKKEFIPFYQEVMQQRLDISIKEVECGNEEEFHDIIRQKLDQNKPVFVPGDSSILYYSSDYKARFHNHFFIIKGYDEEKKLYFILDNMHIDKGASTIYKDFVIKQEDLYQAAESYLTNTNIDKNTIWYFESVYNKEKDLLLSEEVCLEILENMEEFLNTNKMMEFVEINSLKWAQSAIEMINEGISMEQKKELIIRLGNVLTTMNMKKAFWHTMDKIFVASGLPQAKQEQINQIQIDISNAWRPIKLAFYKASEELVSNFSINEKDIERAVNLEYELFKLYTQAKSYVANTIEHKHMNVTQNEYYIDNNDGADISIENNNIKVRLTDTKKYDLWLQDVHAPRIGIRSIANNWSLLATIRYDRESVHNDARYQDGILIELDNGAKLLYGVYDIHGITQLAIFCPEMGEQFTIYDDTKYVNENNNSIKVEKEGKEINFSILNDKNIWVIIRTIEYDGYVSRLELFTRTWENINHYVEFADINYIQG